MRIETLKAAARLLVCVLLGAALVYSAFTVTAESTYAACNCSNAYQFAVFICSSHGGLAYFNCTSTQLTFVCNDGFEESGPCS